MTQALAFHELHHEVRVAADLVEAVHLHQVRVLDAGEQCGLAAQLLDQRDIFGEVRPQHLDRDSALER